MPSSLDWSSPPLKAEKPTSSAFETTSVQTLKMSSLSYDALLEALPTLSFTDKLRLNEELATLIRKEGKSGAVGKAAKKTAKKDGDAPKKAAAPGTLAWIAFVKHCKATMPERFEDCTKEPERLTVAKTIRAEDEAAYKAFCENFKKEHAAASSDEEEQEEAPKPVAKPAADPAEKAAKLAALKAKMAGGGAAAKPAAKEEKKAAKEPKEPKEEKKVKKVPKKVEKKAAAAEEESAEMPKKEIDGVDYFFDAETNGLWMVGEDGGFGAWVGRFQPGNEEEPIRFTESAADE